MACLILCPSSGDFTVANTLIREKFLVQSYPLDLVSQCHPHAEVLLLVLLCVCGASVAHSHPHDRLRQEINMISLLFTSYHLLVSVIFK